MYVKLCYFKKTEFKLLSSFLKPLLIVLAIIWKKDYLNKSSI